MLRQTNKGFENMTDGQWMAWAHRTYCGVNGMPVADYDPRLTKTFPSHEDIMEGRLPSLWPQFKALSRNPVLVLRGEHSDLLTTETVEKMHAIKPDIMAKTVPDRGHVPFLDEPESIEAIDEFLLRFGSEEDHD
jgi:pimeloyl-ACP methyl ester carboxylesterase